MFKISAETYAKNCVHTIKANKKSRKRIFIMDKND